MTGIQNTQNNLNERNHKFFWFCLLFLLGLIFARYSLQINFPRELFLPIAMLMAFCGDRDEILALCMCCIPLHSSLQYAYVVLICLIAFLIKYGKGVKFNLSFIPIVLIVLWELLHCFDIFFSPVKLVHVLLPFALYLVLLSCKNLEFDYGFIVRTFSVTMVGACIMLLGKLLYVADFDWFSAIYNLRRLGHNITEMDVQGGEIQPNTLGIICVLGLTGLMQLWLSKNGRKMDWCLAISLLLFGFLTSSRTFLACLIIMVVCLLLVRSNGVKEKTKLFLVIIVILLITLAIMMLFFPDLLEYYFGRFFEDDITTGRDDLMLFYHDLICTQPILLLFGIGLVNFRVELLSKYIVPHVPHNGIQEMIIAWGIPGSILFCFVMLSMIWRSRTLVRKQTLINFIPLIVLLAKIQAGQMLTSAYTMVAFAYAYLSMCHDFNKTSPK